MSPSYDPEATLPILNGGRIVFGRYRLDRLIGRGGMGVVWLARAEKLDLPVALKFLPDAVLADPDALRDLRRETKRALRLTHENIVRVHTLEEDAASAAIVMEYVDGESLAAWKAAQPDACLGVAALTPLVRQLCTALEYAHETAGVVHRDLKPANLLRTREGTLKITDFGIARSLAETQTRLTNKASETSGTLLYMSPQQMMGGKATPADDIYSLGATLYELLTGKPPFYTGDVFMQVREKVAPTISARRAEFEVGGEPVPAAWEETIAACLAKNPVQRPSSAGEVAARFGLSDAGPMVAGKASRENATVIPAQPERTATSTTSTSKKLRLRLLAALAGAVALAIAGIVFWPQRVAPERSSRGNEAGAKQPAGAKDDRLVTSAATKATEPPVVPVPAAAVVLSREFTVTVDPPDAGARLWLGPQSDVAVPVGGRAILKDLPDGELELTVQAAGYQPLTTRVTVKQGRGSAEARLVAVRGVVEIAARPGTVVTAVDARGRETRMGSVPPGGTLKAENLLTIGSYTFRFAHEDCAPVEGKNIELALGRVAKVAPAQSPLPGELRVFSVPTGAEVSVNGTKLGTTPATLTAQPSEMALQIEVFARGYRRSAEMVTLKPRETRTLNMGTLAAESGSVELRMADAGLRNDPKLTVQVDGKRVERVVPNALLRLEGMEVGERTVEIAHPDYQSWSQRVNVRNQQATSVEVKLVPKPGRIAIRAEPREITLTVNGRAVRSEEIKGGALTVPAGEPLTLVASAKGYKPATRTITLPANGSESWEIALEKQSSPAPGQPWENTLGMKFVPVPGTPVLFGVWDVRVQDYEAFTSATRRAWSKPSFAQTATHPAVNVSWEDAQAFCAWLTKTEQASGRLGPEQSYRLPRDWEWSVAVGLNESRGGTPQSKNAQIKSVYPWGTQWPPPRGSGNYASSLYVDTFAETSPVGSFAANKFGLYDMGGNVWQWCEDFYNGTSGSRVLRGASFHFLDAGYLLSANRSYCTPDGRDDNLGFRCVVAVGGASAP